MSSGQPKRRECDASSLTRRKHADRSIRKFLCADSIKRRTHVVRSDTPTNAHAEGDVFGCGEIGFERRIVTKVGQVQVILGIPRLDALTTKSHFERLRLEQTGQDSKQRCLTRSVGSNDLQAASGRHLETEAPEKVALTPEHMKIFYRQLRHLDDYLKTDSQQPRSRPSLPSAPTDQA